MDFEKSALKIITSASDAKSHCFQALKYFKNENYQLVEEELDKASDFLADASRIHLSILKNEVETNKKDYSLLIIHAEDILLTTSTILEVFRELLTKDLINRKETK